MMFYRAAYETLFGPMPKPVTEAEIPCCETSDAGRLCKRPLVSVRMATYNHEKWIAQAIEGVVNQKTDFEYELVIGEDCSTDRTREICFEYQKRYPDKIRVLWADVNVNSIGSGNAGRINAHCRGEFLATCEGDDYWTDPLKLQKQVEFMEAHEEYSVCFTKHDIHDCFASEYHQCAIDDKSPYVTDISPKEYLYNKFGVGPLTEMFRLSSLDFEWHKHYSHYYDTMEIVHLLDVGKGAVLNFVSGVYNRHQGGVCSSNTKLNNSFENFRDSWEMYKYMPNITTKKLYTDNVKWRLDICKQNQMYTEMVKTYTIAFWHSPFITLHVLLSRLK